MREWKRAAEQGDMMAERTEGSITIEASSKQVMDVLEDFESYPGWAEIKAVEVRERDATGRATQVYYEVSAGPINARYTLAYTYKPSDGGLEWSFVEGSGIKNLEGEYALSEEGSATNVIYRMSVDIPLPPMPGFMKKRLVAEGEKRIIDTALKGLKKRVEER